MKNKTLTISIPKTWLKITLWGLLSLTILGVTFSIKDTMRTPYFIIIIISIIVLLSFTLIHSCILQYQYMQFDKQTKISIDCHSNQITYIRDNVYLEFNTSDITDFHIKDKKTPLIITCVLSSNLEKYIKKKCHVKIADSVSLDKNEYDVILNMISES